MVLDGKKIADHITIRLCKEVASLRAQGVIPGLGILLIGDDPASQLYVSMKEKTAQEIGIKCVLVTMLDSSSEDEVVAILNDMNADATLHGIMIQLPIPKALSRERVCAMISPAKDIDCLNLLTLIKLEEGDATVCPPTAESVARLIEASGRTLSRATAVVVGSGFFARQITFHLRNKGANVEQIPFRDERLTEKTSAADILVSVIGRPKSITSEMIKDGAVVIDVGVTRQDGDVVGDVLFDEVAQKASAITPVPGGVGPVTVAVLLENVVKAAARLVDA